MHWLYIRSDGTKKYYIGETKRLYTRQFEHENGYCKNTSSFNCDKIVAIYKLDNIAKFFYYNRKIIDTGFKHKYMLTNWNDREVESEEEYSKKIETFITEWMMMAKNNEGEYIHNFTDIRGGKYNRFNCTYKFPDNHYVKKLPLCDCDLPCDVKIDKNNYLFFRCPKKNFYRSFKEQFDIEDEYCSFFQKYNISESISLDWLKNVPSHKFLTICTSVPPYCIAYDVINEEKIRKEEGDYYEDWRQEGGRYTNCIHYKYKYMVECNKGIKRAICYECCQKYRDVLAKIFIDISPVPESSQYILPRLLKPSYHVDIL